MKNYKEKSQVAIPIRYEIYLQDLSKDYQDLTLLGHADTIEQARTCCRLLKESLLTAKSRGLTDGRNYDNCTVFFRPILKEYVNNDN